MATYTLNVNGAVHSAQSDDPEQPLLYVLRNGLGLNGPKFGCGLGQCGSCSVLIDGEAARSCTVTVAQAVGRKITTVEGLGTVDRPHPVQAAFIEEQAAQCGYCANGMVIGAVALLSRNPKPTLEEAKQALAGNLCRCGTHQRIAQAVMRAAGRPA